MVMENYFLSTFVMEYFALGKISAVLNSFFSRLIYFLNRNLINSLFNPDHLFFFKFLSAVTISNLSLAVFLEKSS